MENDINVGVYIYSQAITVKEAEEEADYVLNILKNHPSWKITMPVVFDYEYMAGGRFTSGKLSKSTQTQIATAFCKKIANAGYTPMIYANYAMLKSGLDAATLSQKYKIWIARYNITTTSNSKSGTPYSDVAYDYEFWQYTSTSARIGGYSSNIDVNFWYKDTSIKTKGLKMSDNTEDSITLNWSAAGDATGYRIYRYDASTDKYAYVGSTTKKSYTDTDLAEGTGYQYKVRAYWKIGGTNYYGSYSSILSATTSLGKVSDVEVDKSTDTTMTLSWNAVKNATGYRIYQYDEDEESYVELADVEASEKSYKVTDLSGATEYRFKVRAYKTVDTTKYWGSYSEECVDITCPAKVKELNVETDSSTAITLSWNKVARATGYRIYRLNTESGKYQLIKTVKSASTRVYTDEKLASGEAYSYKVRAYKSYDGTNYYGSYSDVRSAATKPAKVKNLKLTTKSSKVTLKWDKVKNATGYQIYRLNTKTGKYEKIATVKGATTCTYKTAKLTKGKTYTYKVRAYKNYDGENYYGSYSTISEVKVK
jgi:fibronectin type 3 domain-containing protein